METKLNIITPLIERVEQFTKTNFELIKLKSIDKSAELASIIISRLVLVFMVSFFLITLTIATSLWLGDLLGKIYYGFFIVSGIYGILGIVFYFIQASIKEKFNNSIIKQILN